MKTLVLNTILLVVTATARLFSKDTYTNAFEQWQRSFDVKYATRGEYMKRLDIFSATHDLIHTHNNRDAASFALAHNQFSDLTDDEFVAQHLPCTKETNERGGDRQETEKEEADDGGGGNKTFVDWQAAGAVTPVQNQGGCGSCYAFAAAGALEGAWVIGGNALTAFSKQMLVDCDTYDGGCGGGLMNNAYEWITDTGGLCTEESYPYRGYSWGTCFDDACVKTVRTRGYVQVPPNNETALERAVRLTPVSVAIDASSPVFRFYGSGVLDDVSCGLWLNHAAVVTGYGTDDATGGAYWRIKNSWGTSWGEDGFMRLAKGVAEPKGMCGIAKLPTYPLLADACYH